MAGRLLRQWIVRPLVDVTEIQARLAVIEEFVNNIRIRAELRQTLRDIQDLQRLNSRIALGVATPRDILGLQKSLNAFPSVRTLLDPLHSTLVRNLLEDWE